MGTIPLIPTLYKFGNMNLNIQSLINAYIKADKAYEWLSQMKEMIDEDTRRQDLRKGSIDVEFRVIEE